MSINDLLEDTTINIPEHQRAYVWNYMKQSALIDTIMEGLPTHALFLYQDVIAGKIQRDLEDGQQRWMTVKKFTQGEFVWRPLNQPQQERKFTDFTSAEQSKFLRYSFTIYLMEQIPMEMRLSLFQRLQDGTPLTNGQRFKAASHLPIVKLAKDIMNDPRCHEAWGSHKDTKGNTVLANAMAIASALALGNSNWITTSYGILGPEIYKAKDTPMNKDLVESRLTQLLSVYARADVLHPTTHVNKKKQWKVGTFTGYILYTILQPDRVWEEDMELWANYIVRVRRDEASIGILRFKTPNSRNWTAARWHQGLLNVQDPESIHISADTSVSYDDDEDDDE